MMIPAIDFNVIKTSVMRVGFDWAATHLSDIHKQIYGLPIKWIYIDKEPTGDKVLPYIDDHFDIPQGWTGIYNIKPQILLDRGYDKVIVYRRNKKDWMNAVKLYLLKVWTVSFAEKFEWAKDLTKEDFDKELEGIWDWVYLDIPNDIRLHVVDSEALNNHTSHEFNKLCDFLEFRRIYKPILGRPITLPVKPTRNWEKYSSSLPVDSPYCSSLNTIGTIYDKALDKILNEELDGWFKE